MSITITVRANGPLFVSGEVEIIGADGKPLDVSGQDRIALCRCGQSSKKPFCDGTHQKVGFTDPSPAA